MARGKAFGQTWWGNAWVEALERIDRDTNRLPRGRGYARGNRVSQIQVSAEGMIRARVKGRRSSPYRVELSLQGFTSPEVKAIQTLVAHNPALATELSLGRLPQVMLEALEGKGINLLPASWDQIEARCSCPDWANPCKHLAAVYYILANEIDKDPFILFALRRVTRETLLEASGFSRAEPHPVSDGAAEESFFLPWDRYRELERPAEEDGIDLSSLAREGQGKPIFDLLQGTPHFEPRYDFKKKLLHAYDTCSRALADPGILENGYSFRNVRFTLLYTPLKKPKKKGSPLREAGEVFRDHAFFLSPEPGTEFPPGFPFRGQDKGRNLPSLQDGKVVVKRARGILVPAGEVIDYFLRLPLELPPEAGSAGAGFLSAAVSTCQALGQAQGFIPQVEEVGDDGSFALFYRPLPRSFAAVSGHLGCLMPPFFLLSLKGKKAAFGDEGLDALVRLILTHMVTRFCRDEALPGEPLQEAFFQGKYYIADTFEKKHTGRAVANWLAWLNAIPVAAVPRIKIGLPRKEGQKFPLVVEVKNAREPLAPAVPLSRVFAPDEEVEKVFSRPAPQVRQEVARQLTIAGEHMPILKDILQHKGKMGGRVSPSAMAQFLGRTRDVFRLLGIGVVIPRKLKSIASPRAALTARSTGKGGTTYLNLADMLDFSWQVALGDRVMDHQEFRRLADRAGQIIQYRDEYLLLDAGEVQRILEKLDSPRPGLSSLEILRGTISGEVGGTPFIADKLVRDMVEALGESRQVEIPAGLKANLRPYQHRGVSWLYENTLRGLGSCLADDMGLGKTLQVIALLLKLKEEGRLEEPALVVCPTTLIGNWQREIARFAPGLRADIYHGSSRRLTLKNMDIIITSYGLARRDQARFKRKTWGVLVMDEAQNIKNPDTEQTRAVKGIPSRVAIALTGTPVENRLMELWSIYDAVNPGYLGKRKEFLRTYALPIEKYRDRQKIEIFKQITAPFMLRREKKDSSVIKDLPPKTVLNDYCYLTGEQAALYQQVTATLLEKVEESGGIERRGLIFKLITALKQICNHPAHYSGGGDPDREASGKAAKTMDLLQGFAAAGEKALIFTQYREMGFLLSRLIEKEMHREPLFFHGGLTRSRRDEMVKEFQGEAGPPVMIISLKAGGTGLNLTAAARVIHYDLWWNPAVEDQATDRTYRIGQTRQVMVHRLISMGTFEEKINAMMEDKRELAELTVAAGEARISEMSNAELRELVMLTGEGRE